MSSEEFESALKEKTLVETFMDSEGYWKQYQVFVCPAKGAWESSMKSGKRLALVCVKYSHTQRPGVVVCYTHDGREVAKDEGKSWMDDAAMKLW